MPLVTAERTPLYEDHLRLHAQLTTFGGWTMPLQYTSIREEHTAVRQAVGLFDLSHMGEVEIRGRAAAALTDRVVSNDVAGLKPGRARYALLCSEQGGILDDLLVYAEEGRYLLVVNAANQDRDHAWIRDHAPADAAVANVGRETALLGVQGPRAAELMARLADRELGQLRYYAFISGRVAGVACRISRTGYTGEDGFEIFCQPVGATVLWRALLEEGRDLGIRPAGLGARDTLRLEAGMRLYGNDIDEETNALEAGLEWTVKLDKDFIGRDALLGARQRGLRRQLVGLKLLDRSIPRHGYPVVHEGKPVGTVTSGNVSFTLGYNIAMAYVPPTLTTPGTRLAVQVRSTQAPADVVELPFYKRPHPR